MKLVTRSLITLGSLVILSGCSTLSEQECVNADWYLIGLEDGSRGYSVSRIGSHREACAKYSVVPNIESYRSGLSEGYKTYCAEANGYNTGLTGATYQNVCSGQGADKFVQAYQHGRDLYRLRQALASLDQQISDSQNTIEQLNEDSALYEEQLIHHASAPSERQKLLNAIKDNEQEAATLAESMVYSERERAVLAQDLADMEAYHRQLGYQ
ncbi:DUF2799 domain-containing protein [Gilvimarinus sp. SDUM040013]|uniref:DUF2799 domain-containing protein n=1 Tax=Gilvimarinus gilvus TaxID=3058038 RepID=A0ABU4RSX9_9GAMM|nr:DUF2799 domain-containing protein [Gilvimarinus sp. SDUM040013]MDO3387112.1 DUF2799 domain-containing protein [Gilvimarinus sp. SDUM040013]MDX6847993.1 DUF2799 domain-containing protein [Gilvimarinus sp. SDUM040013]